ncbi:hypothetical protein [Sphingomonas sp.]|uniref:hypothetical protein n=1 Tax=Sphingomonas sp. TaxID=28214 RepID=UPI003F729682
MKMYFRVLFPATGEAHSEFDLTPPTSPQAQAMAHMPLFEGEIVIADGDSRLVIPGALEAWAQNLCFDAMIRALAGEGSHFANFSGPGGVAVEPEGDRVRLTTDDGATATFPRATLAPALVACGGRILDWARARKSDDPTYLANLDYIEAFRRKAEAALT